MVIPGDVILEIFLSKLNPDVYDLLSEGERGLAIDFLCRRNGINKTTYELARTHNNKAILEHKLFKPEPLISGAVRGRNDYIIEKLKLRENGYYRDYALESAIIIDDEDYITELSHSEDERDLKKVEYHLGLIRDGDFVFMEEFRESYEYKLGQIVAGKVSVRDWKYRHPIPFEPHHLIDAIKYGTPQIVKEIAENLIDEYPEEVTAIAIENNLYDLATKHKITDFVAGDEKMMKLLLDNGYSDDVLAAAIARRGILVKDARNYLEIAIAAAQYGYSHIVYELLEHISKYDLLEIMKGVVMNWDKKLFETLNKKGDNNWSFNRNEIINWDLIVKDIVKRERFEDFDFVSKKVDWLNVIGTLVENGYRWDAEKYGSRVPLRSIINMMKVIRDTKDIKLSDINSEVLESLLGGDYEYY